jgi:hypothetical protein
MSLPSPLLVADPVVELEPAIGTVVSRKGVRVYDALRATHIHKLRSFLVSHFRRAFNNGPCHP